MEDYVDKFFKKLRSKKVIAVLVIIVIAIIGISQLLRASEDIYYRFFPRPKPELSDKQLKEQALELARDIAQYVADRKKNEPEIDYNDWEGSTERIISYSQETIDLYYVRYGPEVAMIREEFLKRGIKDEEFERLYEHPTNYIGLQMLTLRLAAMAAKLET